MASPKWCLYEAFCAVKLLMCHRAQPYCIAECTPMPASLRGALFNERFAYQYAARASAIVFLSVSVRIPPTASYRNRVMMTGAITRAIEAREHMLATGPAEK